MLMLIKFHSHAIIIKLAMCEQDLFQYTCNWNNSFGMVVEILLFSEYGKIEIVNNHFKILNGKG